MLEFRQIVDEWPQERGGLTRDERANALARLVGLVEMILNPLGENVVGLRGRAS